MERTISQSFTYPRSTKSSATMIMYYSSILRLSIASEILSCYSVTQIILRVIITLLPGYLDRIVQ